MKTKKSRIVLSAVSVLLVFSLLVGGTMAWFTDTEKVNANFTAGVLDISVTPGEKDAEDLKFENLRPMLYKNFYNELDDNGSEKWDNDVTQKGNTGLKDSDYKPVPAYFKPVVVTNEGTLPTIVKISMTAATVADKEPILTKDNVTIKQVPGAEQDCANRLAPVLKVFIYKDVDGEWTLVKDTNLNNAYDEKAANPDEIVSENTARESYNTYTTVVIPAGGSERYVIAGYLPETVNNAYQGQHYHGQLVLNAYQADEGAGGGTPDSGSSEKPDPDDPFKNNVTIEWREGTATGTLVKSLKDSVTADATISAADYAAPANYAYDPADQSTAVTVNKETGVVTPATVIFTVKKTDSDFAGGDGTEENPFLIMNAQQFNKIRDYSDKFFILGANIELGDYTPTPSLSGGLNGEYKGTAYTVSYSIDGSDNLGLFVNNTGVLKNLTVEGTINSSGNNVGSVAVINAGAIQNCTSSVEINGTLTTFDDVEANPKRNNHFGGLVSTNAAKGTIQNSSFTGTINPELTLPVQIAAIYYDSHAYIGGLAAHNEGTIEDCSLTVPENGRNVSGSNYVGGIVAVNEATGVIKNVTTTGVTADFPVTPSSPELFTNSQTVAVNNGTYQ